MIDAYDQQTGDGQWLRQSLQILQECIDGAEHFIRPDNGANPQQDKDSDEATRLEISEGWRCSECVRQVHGIEAG
jgi:hypothetical protein